MYPDLRDKKVLLTGASRGIGFTATGALLRAGCRVFTASRRTDFRQRLGNTAPELANLTALTCDFTDPEQMRRLADSIPELDILILNAGYFKAGLISETDDRQWKHHLDVNLTAPFFLVRAFWEKLIRSRGTILFISSLAGVANMEKFATSAAYTASKMGVVGLCDVVAVEGRPHGIRANCLSPGSVDTEMLRENYPQMRADFTPEQITAQILFHVSDISRPLSGTNIVIKV